MNRICLTLCFALLTWFGQAALTVEADPVESDYYRIVTLPIPKEIVLEAGGIEVLPDKRVAVSTRRGEIWLIDNAFSDPPTDVKFKLFASGLHEVLGLSYRDGWFYVTQRCDVSRLKDTNGDDRADVFEVVNDGWEINGDYHEYAFGSPFDKNGNIWVVLCLTGSFNSSVKYRGWAVQITPEGKLIPTCSGVRSPGGIGPNATGDMFYTDNQGPWNGSCNLKHIKPGRFLGHPDGNKWYDVSPNMGKVPATPTSNSRWPIEAAKIPELLPPAVWFPYPKMGQSASGIATDMSAGKFGPFAEQMFVSDQSHSTVMRVALEKVNGEYQGACFPFRGSFSSGNLAMKQTADGSMFIGGTNRGWGSRGREPWALERLVWTGKTPFEVHMMSVRPDGFELTFTEPVDPKTAGDAASYKLGTYTYIYQSNYGSPEVDHTTPTIKQLTVSADGRKVRMIVDGLQIGHVHELHLDGVKSAAGLPLLHKEAYYTLNYLPKE
jgi:hypothetical protein